MIALQAAIDQFERAACECALVTTFGNVAGAARVLGLSRTTLWERIRKYGLRVEEYRAEVPLDEEEMDRPLTKRFQSGSEMELAILEMIALAMREAKGVKSDAARILGVDRHWLARRVPLVIAAGFEVYIDPAKKWSKKKR